MIRLPATTIILGRSDLLDYEKRQRTRGRDRDRERISETDKLNERLTRFAVRSQPASTDLGQSKPGQDLVHDAQDHHEQTHAQNPGQLLLEEATIIDIPEAHDEPNPELPAQDSTGLHEDASELSLQEGEHEYVSVVFEHCPENTTHETPQPVSQSKHDFYYGGFIETASPSLTDYTPLTPNDASTPQQLPIPNSNRPNSNRLRPRNQLPRSPLYVSQNVSSSPERRPTSGLTPRVASRVATHNTPGIIFSQPARRPPRISTRTSMRTFRHQTNSFSFDSSERSSAAYEQERAVSDSSDGRARSATNINLHEDLRGSSLQSSRAGSATSYRVLEPPEVLGEGEPLLIDMDEEDEVVNRIVGFSSPRLCLPPPFSTVTRSVSGANSLPYPPTPVAGSQPTSPFSPSISPVRGIVESRHPSHRSSPTAAEHESVESNSPSGSRFNPVTLVNRALSVYRTRSPFSRQGSPQPTSPSPSASPTPRQDQSRQPPANAEPVTPSRAYQVYNDAVSPNLQPQTPAHLPESRHQSRYHPSYTAPVTRAAARRGLSVDDVVGDGLQQSLPHQRQAPSHTPSRGGRSASPIGLVGGGFQGLYGGRENGHEEQSWVEGVRFNNAEARLWGTRDAQNDSGSLRQTPEPDEWRVGRRN
ncbi:hypothetical protein BKA65DRAFT_477840 [Rhexocercosporidium sp. MPI-PUGE-AT-0058]|nr:hypothetical protein BKA65DRAFT_477840 [Rhexocercosporidium sp. MPI-PUGE-AT-0058]